MNLGPTLAALALATLTVSVPATAAKDDKLPRCNGQKKRPANLYGSVLPTVPERGLLGAVSGGVPRGTPSSSPAPATNLFPSNGAAPASQGADAPQTGKVPAIGAIGLRAGSAVPLSTSYASC